MNKFSIIWVLVGLSFMVSMQGQVVDIQSRAEYSRETCSMFRDLFRQLSPVAGVSRTGLSVGLDASYGQSMIDNQIISAITMESDDHIWDIGSNDAFSLGLSTWYFFNKNIALKSGFLYNTFGGRFSLSGQFTDRNISYDVNSDEYHAVISADYDSVVNMKYLSIPLTVNYVSGKPGGIDFYAETGAVLGLRLSSGYHTSGDYEFYGYYPYHIEPLQILDIEELGFWKRTNIDVTGDPGTASMSFSGYASIGLNISLAYHSSFRIGPEVYWGINDIDAGKEFVDTFGVVRDHKPTLLKKYSIRMSYILKL